MCKIQVRIYGTVLVQPKVFVRWREALQEVRGNQLVKLCEAGFEEWVLVACGDCRRSEVATDVVVRYPTKQHGRFDEQQKGVGVFWGVIDEQIFLGHVLWIIQDASLWQRTIRCPENRRRAHTEQSPHLELKVRRC